MFAICHKTITNSSHFPQVFVNPRAPNGSCRKAFQPGARYCRSGRADAAHRARRGDGCGDCAASGLSPPERDHYIELLPPLASWQEGNALARSGWFPGGGGESQQPHQTSVALPTARMLLRRNRLSPPDQARSSRYSRLFDGISAAARSFQKMFHAPDLDIGTQGRPKYLELRPTQFLAGRCRNADRAVIFNEQDPAVRHWARLGHISFV